MAADALSSTTTTTGRFAAPARAVRRWDGLTLSAAGIRSAAVVVFLALAVVGLTSLDDQTVRGTYLVMERAAWFVLVPLAFGSLLTGIVQSLVTPWGLFRHYWVIFKLLINVLATAVLLMYMDTFRSMAAVAADRSADLARRAEPTPQPARFARTGAVAGGHGAGRVQAAGHYPVRVA